MEIAALEKSGYMLEYPRIPHYRARRGLGDNVTGADNQQERPAGKPVGILRGHTPDIQGSWMKRWSHLHGDMQERRPARGASTWATREDFERNSLSGKFRPARMA